MESLPKYFCLFIFCLFVNKSVSQKVSLSIILDTKNKELTKLNYQKKHLSKNSAIKEIDQVLLYLKQKGYLLATCDSIKSDSNKVTGIINENKKFTLAYLKLGNLNFDTHFTDKNEIFNLKMQKKSQNHKEPEGSL